MRICKECNEEKPLDKFGPLQGGRYRRHVCYSCWGSAWREKAREHDRAYRKKRRKARPVQMIWQDSRRDDKRKGRDNDLTKEFIAEQIVKGCSYCGEKDLRMTLDRIDTLLGHLQTNVVPACIRCNYVRGNMPHEAWVVLARAMKRARTQGLFGEWTGRAR